MLSVWIYPWQTDTHTKSTGEDVTCSSISHPPNKTHGSPPAFLQQSALRASQWKQSLRTEDAAGTQWHWSDFVAGSNKLIVVTENCSFLGGETGGGGCIIIINWCPWENLTTAVCSSCNRADRGRDSWRLLQLRRVEKWFISTAKFFKRDSREQEANK